MSAFKLSEMTSFARVEGASVSAKKGGVYLQAPLYQRGDELFIPGAGGFVRLLGDGNTSLKTATWHLIEGVRYQDTFRGPAMISAPYKLAAVG